MKTFNYQNTLTYSNSGKKYTIFICYKNKKTISFSLENNNIYVRAPLNISNKTILRILDNNFNKLIKKQNKSPSLNMPLGLSNKGIFILGEEVEFDIDNSFTCFGHKFIFKDLLTFYKEVKPYFCKYLENLLYKYENLMNVPYHNKMYLKVMKSLYGSIRVTKHHVTFNMILLHFSEEIISSIVIHELTHIKYKGHQANFYKEMSKYCPNYKEIRNKLNKRIYK